MIKKIAKPALSLTCCALLVACGGPPASNELQLDKDGDGGFSGRAGSDWTAGQIRTQISGDACGTGSIVDFRVSVLPSAPGYTIFSGRCTSSGEGFPAATGQQNQIVNRTPATRQQVATPGNSATWDGSTPFVD